MLKRSEKCLYSQPDYDLHFCMVCQSRSLKSNQDGRGDKVVFVSILPNHRDLLKKGTFPSLTWGKVGLSTGGYASF